MNTRQRLWQQGAPGALGIEPADIPDLAAFLPDQLTGGAVIVCPGGGYGNLAAHEDEPFCLWLNTLGIAAFSLHYRLGPKYRHPIMLNDAARAIRTVRYMAREFKIDPKRIGILGFSAGGHLASTASVHFDGGVADAPDPIDRHSSRPDLSVLVYPVVRMDGSSHGGSRTNLLGPDPSAEMKEYLSNDKHVTANTPPAFLYHRAGDPAVPSQDPLRYALALANAGVRYELHVYDHAGHGQGFAASDAIDGDWSIKLASWLKRMGF